MEGEPIRARPVGMLERASKWVRRNRAVAFLGGAAALALVAGTMVSLLFAAEARQQADNADQHQWCKQPA